jgi:hypothetical protein
MAGVWFRAGLVSRSGTTRQKGVGGTRPARWATLGFRRGRARCGVVLACAGCDGGG